MLSATATCLGCTAYSFKLSTLSNVVSNITSAVELGRHSVLTFTSISPGICPARPSSPSLIPALTCSFSSHASSSFNFHKITCFTIIIAPYLFFYSYPEIVLCHTPLRLFYYHKCVIKRKSDILQHKLHLISCSWKTS